MRDFFDRLDDLELQLIAMGELVRSSVDRCVRSLMERRIDLAEAVISDEILVNRYEIEIDDVATELFARNQPVAIDMRRLIAALKINTDLERMGDLSVNIARRAKYLIEHQTQDFDVAIPEMSGLVQHMVASSLHAFVKRDSVLARTVLASDDEVDRLRSKIYEERVKKIEAGSQHVRVDLGYIFIARNLERIADHSTNIAEDVIFLVEALDVRHSKERLP